MCIFRISACTVGVRSLTVNNCNLMIQRSLNSWFHMRDNLKATRYYIMRPNCGTIFEFCYRKCLRRQIKKKVFFYNYSFWVMYLSLRGGLWPVVYVFRLRRSWCIYDNNWYQSLYCTFPNTNFTLIGFINRCIITKTSTQVHMYRLETGTL